MKIIDLTGRRYGDFTIIDRIRTENDKYHKWICRCICGNEIILDSYYIRNVWKGTDCGCKTTLVGKTFGKLKIIEKVGKKINTLSNYICQCECGKFRTYRATYLLYGKVKSCGCARIHTARNNGLTVAFNTYRKHARIRDLDFSLSKIEFEKLINTECFYCGKTETNKTQVQRSKNLEHRYYLHNGVDRIDNSKGYTLDNSIPCCKLCNHMKWNLSFDEWKKHIALILRKCNVG